MTHSQITSTTCEGNGGLLYLRGAKSLIFTDNSITTVTTSGTKSGALVYLRGSGTKASTEIASVKNNDIFCKSSIDTLTATSTANSANGTFFFESYNSVVSESNDFANCSISEAGGAFYLSLVDSFTDSSSTFYNIVAISGGVFYCDGACTLTL